MFLGWGGLDRREGLQAGFTHWVGKKQAQSDTPGWNGFSKGTKSQFA